MGNQSASAIYTDQIISTYDLHKPEILDILVRKYGDQGVNFFTWMISMGFEKPVAQTDFSHFWENKIQETVTVTVNAGGAAGAAVTITLSASDYISASLKYIYPRVGDLVIIPNGGNDYINAYVSAVSTAGATPTITIYPEKITEAIPAYTGELSVITNVNSEGSGQPTPRMTGATKWSNKTQIIKEAIGSTGSELTNQSWLNNGDSWFNVTYQIDLDYRMSSAISGALMFAKGFNNTNVTGTNGNPLYGTRGMLEDVKTYGLDNPYTPGTLSISDFYYWDKYLQSQFVSAPVCLYFARDLYNETQGIVHDFMKYTGVQYDTKAVADSLFINEKADVREQMMVNANISAFSIGGRRYAMRRNYEFENPQTTATSGLSFPKWGLIFPLERNAVDPKTREKMPNIGIRYKKLGQYSRRMETFSLGSAGPIKIATTDLDSYNLHQRCELGGHWMKSNQFIRLTA